MNVIDVHSHLYWENGRESSWEIHQARPGAIGPEVYLQAVRGSLLGRGGRMVIYAGSGIRQFREDPDAVRRANEAAADLVAMAPDLFVLGFTPDPFHLETTLAIMVRPSAPSGSR